MMRGIYTHLSKQYIDLWIKWFLFKLLLKTSGAKHKEIILKIFVHGKEILVSLYGIKHVYTPVVTGGRIFFCVHLKLSAGLKLGERITASFYMYQGIEV